MPPLLSMRKLFPNHPHTYFLLMYFITHALSLFWHSKYVYLLYEVFFLIYLILVVRAYKKLKVFKSSIIASGIIHALLTILYAIVLFLIQKVGTNSTLFWLILYPAGHFLINVITLISLKGLTKLSR